MENSIFLFKSTTKALTIPFFINNTDEIKFQNNIKSMQNSDQKSQSEISNDDKHDIYKKWILNRLNNLCQKIESELHIPLFNKTKISSNDEYLYVDKSIETYQLNKHDTYRFSFIIDINKDTFFSKLFQKIKILFYFDSTIYRISGAIILEKNQVKDITYDQSIDQYYFYNFLVNFAKKHFDNFTLESYLHQISRKQQNNKIIYNVTNIHNEWGEAFKHAFNNSSYFQNEVDSNNVFYALLIGIANSILVVQEIKNIFTNDNLDNIKIIEKQNIKGNLEFDLNKVLLYFYGLLNNQYRLNIANTKKRSWSDNLSKIEKELDDYYFCGISLVEDVTPFLDYNYKKVQQYFDNDKYFNYLILSMHPEHLRIDFSSIDNYNSLVNLKNELSNLDDISHQSYLKDFKSSLCQNNIYLFSLIKNDRVIIFEKDINLNHINYYYWSKIYIETKIREKEIFEDIKISINRSKIHWKNIPYRKLMRDIEDISYNENSHFYGLSNIVYIVGKIDNEHKFSSQLEAFNINVQFDDELYKRGTERSNFLMSYIVAIIVGFINFFAMVFSATSDSGTVQNGWPGLDSHFPWVGVSLTFVVMIQIFAATILIFAIFRLIYIKNKYKKVDSHHYIKF